MNRRRAIVALGMAGLVGTLAAQAPADKPLTEQELLKKMDAIGTPAAKPRLGLEGTGLDEAKKAPPPKKEKGETTITALRATFNQKTREAVFFEKVVVIDPEFNVECDRLDAFLKPEKTAGADPAPGAKPSSTPKAPSTPKASPAAKPSPAANPAPGANPPGAKAADSDKDKDQGNGGGLDHAIADADPGKIVLITQDKVEADGSITKNIGKGRRATYDANTGDVVLTGNPSVQQGTNLCVATEDTTVMTLNRDGRMKVDGPHKMIIKDSATIEGKDSKEAK